MRVETTGKVTRRMSNDVVSNECISESKLLFASVYIALAAQKFLGLFLHLETKWSLPQIPYQYLPKEHTRSRLKCSDFCEKISRLTASIQILELSTYLVRNRPEEERASFTSPLRDAFRSEEGNKSIEADEARRKLIFSKVFDEVKGLGDGNEKGASTYQHRCTVLQLTFVAEVEGFFNLLYAHLFALYPPDSSEAKTYLTTLLQTLSSSPSDRLSIKYRMLDTSYSPCHVFDICFADLPTSSIQSLATPPFVSPCTTLFWHSRRPMTTSTFSSYQEPM